MNEESSSGGKRRHFTKEERCELVAKYERSGLTQRVFVEKHGMSLATLTNWLRVHRRNKVKTPSKEVGFRSVDLSGLLGGAQAWAAEVVLPDGSVVRLGSQVNATLAVGLVKLLRRAC